MATARPFAYNPGATGAIPGTEQIGNLSIGVPLSGFSSTGLEWWNGPDEELGYVIACQVPTDTQPTPVPGITGASVGFFRSRSLTEESFINLTNQLFNQIFLTGDQCKIYLNNNGYWTSWGAIPGGMVLYLDTGISGSYPGSGTTWYDLSGYGNNGTIHGATYIGGTAAALDFNGTSSDYVDFSSVNQIPIGNEPYTISVWFNSDEMPSIRGFIGWGEFGSVNQVNAWRLQVIGATGSGFVHYWWGNDLTYATPMTTGTWYNAIAAYQDGSRKIYLNNVQVAEDFPTGHNVPYATNLKVGVSYPGFNEFFNGKIAQVIVYKRQATTSEIEAIWNSGKNRFGYSTPVINLIMDLDSTLGISGSSWSDQSGNGNNATMYGGYGTTGYNGGQVVTLDGTNGYVFPTGGFGTNLDTGFTYEMWAYPTKTGNGTLIAEWSGTPPTGWNDTQIAFVSGTINAGVFPNTFSPDSYLTGPSFTAFTWYNIVMTYDDSSGDLKLYVDGSLIGTTVGTKSNPSGTYLTMGRPDTANSYIGGATGYFQGYLGSWKIWNGPLSASSVLSNYNSTKSRYDAQLVTSGLVIQLDANDSSSYPGTGTTVYNLQSGSYNHTLSGVSYTVLSGVKCFDANGASALISVPDGTGPTLPSTGYTYVTWARVKSSSAGYRTLFRTKPNDHPILVQVGTDNLGFWDNDSAGFIDSGYDVTPIVDVWVQYAVIGDSSSSTFYINGSQVGSTVAYGAAGNTHWAWGGLGGQPFGYVANMYYYNRKLSLSEIQQNYNFLSPRF